MLRLLHIIIVAALVLAAADVYDIKFDAARQAQQVAKLRLDIRHERDAIAALRAEWTELDNPQRIQGLVQRHLALKPIDVTQFDSLDHLPDQPPSIVPRGTTDPIGAIIETHGAANEATGSISSPTRRR